MVIDVSFFSLFLHGVEWYYQIIIGLVYGLVTAWAGWQLISSKLLFETRDFYSSIITQLRLDFPEILFISFCAGVGEEIFFRGAVQYYLGIWFTSILFVAIHGYLNPFNWKLSLYGIYMTCVIAGIGYGFEYAGMISCMAAHFAIDAYLLTKLKQLTS